MLAGCDFEANVVDMEVASGGMRLAFQPEGRRRVMQVAFSPDGQVLAMAIGHLGREEKQPGLIVLWDISRNRRLATLAGHESGVTCIAFAPDGKTIYSGSSDRTIRVWDVTNLGSGGASK
jgi:WD40 repeat protein